MSNVDQHFEETFDQPQQFLKAQAFESCKKSIAQRLGCQSKCPGCGAKCSRPEPHEDERVEQWRDPCHCPPDKSQAFHGAAYYKKHTPALQLCYQWWRTPCVYRGDDDEVGVFPVAKYYNEKYRAWYNDLNQLSTTGVACSETISPPDQRRAWMVVRHTLIKHYNESHKMIADPKGYGSKLYPSNVEALPADFQLTWKNEDFEF
ncbi:unnamed protein product [Didymodactylos carnosus]|uniref:Uncharacterized protein n=1 Tax=Didymodactylos carnosus TaxID=1234261 RepID=A0A813ZAA4_9BILA|nr:unnamed protein product [Didymodactylos carnosus]CAF1548401.1 unnamed protein product [Didymodactylos carnosus]CAF3679187.1 unnamed protein product [Didymodactylos carnosus]CAF4337950.1 unnamed protein product [Didymodactylos carnosus]